MLTFSKNADVNETKKAGISACLGILLLKVCLFSDGVSNGYIVVGSNEGCVALNIHVE